MWQSVCTGKKTKQEFSQRLTEDSKPVCKALEILDSFSPLKKKKKKRSRNEVFALELSVL